jgi:poly(3-hydroxybutyrate) depolymerase
LPTGKSSLRFLHRAETLEVHTYKPASYQGGPILFVIHGQGRNADGYRDYGIPLAERHGVIVVTPQFDATRYPGERFQRGGVLRDGKVTPREEWTYAAIPALADLVRRLEGRPDLPYSLIGHSAGGQFAVRLAALMPGQAVRIVAANPGSLLFPTRDARWGYGFGGLPSELSNDEALRAYLAAPLTLLLGTSDTAAKIPTSIAPRPPWPRDRTASPAAMPASKLPRPSRGSAAGPATGKSSRSPASATPART